MAKNNFFEEICDGVLCEAAESFEDEALQCIILCQFVYLRALLFLLAVRKSISQSK